MSRELILAFWKAMATNDFHHASRWLDPAFEYYMPQTREYLRGPEAFAALTTAYPAAGKWRFAVRSVVADGHEAVSDVEVTDGTVTARAVTFHSVENNLIRRQVEYWPDPYAPPQWRSQWVRVVDDFPF